ncbi:MAG: NapC/NirT family cytochrome c [Terriglobales bacterium]
MSFMYIILLSSIAIAMLLIGTLVARPAITASRGGKMLAFIALFLMPVVLAAGGARVHLETSKKTSFCLSCHIMKPYGVSLRADDPTYLAAAHYINRRIPTEEACYTCHTDYTMFGDAKSKVRGLKHVWVWMTQDWQPPLKLYTPYDNANCLHCHAGAKTFEEGAVHNADLETMVQVKQNKLSCTSSGCHDVVHNAMKTPEKLYPEPPR